MPEDPELFRQLKLGLTISSDKATRPLKNTPYDVITVATPEQSPRTLGKFDANCPSILVEIDWG